MPRAINLTEHKKQAVSITQDRANEIVSRVLYQAREWALDGRLSAFTKGYALGQLCIIDIDLRADRFLVEGARNEIRFLDQQRYARGAA